MNPFLKLAPFLQEYIYNNNWTELRDIQARAIDEIMDGKNNVLIASSTASGKTEAAFLPIISLLSKNFSECEYEHEFDIVNEGVFVMYIAPIKALINDQFERINELLKNCYENRIIPFHWHGDVSSSAKQKFCQKPSPILQITPESLEGLVSKNTHYINTFFRNLKFIVIDEAHLFMQNDRGLQTLSLLERIQRLTHNVPRRIGLSATLGDLEKAVEWLEMGSGKSTTIIDESDKKRTIRLMLEAFTNSDEYNELLEFVYEKSLTKKTLVFANSRQEVEKTIAQLREYAEKNNTADIYNIHHGSISTEIRHLSEKRIKQDTQSVTVATVTMELGIDVGRLERIIQIGAPSSVASFLQRLGRSGRRGLPPEMLMVTNIMNRDGMFLDKLPWDLIKGIAILELYLKDKWIEPYSANKYPYSLLYHQTMGVLLSNTHMRPKDLAREILSLSVFKNITLDDYKILLNNLIEIGHIEKTEEGYLIIGLEGEKIANSYRFYAVFKERAEMTVKNGAETIGTIDGEHAIGEIILLAGRVWKINEINLLNKTIFVESAKGSGEIIWKGSPFITHSKIVAKMKEVLDSNDNYAYLKQNGTEYLKQARAIAARTGITKKTVVRLGENLFAVMPWLGSNEFLALELRAKHLSRHGEIKISSVASPYFIIIESEYSSKELEQMLNEVCNEYIPYEKLLEGYSNLKVEKYDDFIPTKLLQKSLGEKLKG